MRPINCLVTDIQNIFFFVCSAEERNTYRLGTTWGVNDEKFFICGWTIPKLNLSVRLYSISHFGFIFKSCNFPTCTWCFIFLASLPRVIYFADSLWKSCNNSRISFRPPIKCQKHKYTVILDTLIWIYPQNWQPAQTRIRYASTCLKEGKFLNCLHNVLIWMLVSVYHG